MGGRKATGQRRTARCPQIVGGRKAAGWRRTARRPQIMGGRKIAGQRRTADHCKKWQQEPHPVWPFNNIKERGVGVRVGR